MALARSSPIPACCGCRLEEEAKDRRRNDPQDIADRRRTGGHRSFNRGFPTGIVALSGGGSLDPVTGVGQGSGGFRCLEDVAQSKLNGCRAGEGVRWDTVSLLRTTTFKCTGAASEALKSAATGPTTAVIQADFYRAGDGNDESFTAQIIVSQDDIAPDLDPIASRQASTPQLGSKS